MRGSHCCEVYPHEIRGENPEKGGNNLIMLMLEYVHVENLL